MALNPSLSRTAAWAPTSSLKKLTPSLSLEPIRKSSVQDQTPHSLAYFLVKSFCHLQSLHSMMDISNLTNLSCRTKLSEKRHSQAQIKSITDVPHGNTNFWSVTERNFGHSSSHTLCLFFPQVAVIWAHVAHFCKLDESAATGQRPLYKEKGWDTWSSILLHQSGKGEKTSRLTTSHARQKPLTTSRVRQRPLQCHRSFFQPVLSRKIALSRFFKIAWALALKYCWGPALHQSFCAWQMAVDLGPSGSSKNIAMRHRNVPIKKPFELHQRALFWGSHFT